MKKRPFIIDCDTGTDDAVALVVALYCEQVDLKACTAVNGNVPLEYTARNTLNMMDYFKQTIPVAKGAWRPLVRKQTMYAESSHGKTGLGTVILPDAASQYSNLTAPELIYKIAREQQGELELVVIGPMTNIAIALLLHPDLPGLVKHLYFMGGAVRGGNVTPTAEFNIWVDPEAAKIVLESGIAITMVGLDVTEKAFVEPEENARIREIGTKASDFVADLLEFMFDRKTEDTYMHDALALASAVYPECMQYQNCYVEVECRGKLTAGHTFADLHGRTEKEPNVKMAVQVDRKKFVGWLISCIEKSAGSAEN